MACPYRLLPRGGGAAGGAAASADGYRVPEFPVCNGTLGHLVFTKLVSEVINN